MTTKKKSKIDWSNPKKVREYKKQYGNTPKSKAQQKAYQYLSTDQ